MANLGYAEYSMTRLAEPYFGRAVGIGLNRKGNKLFAFWAAEGRSPETRNRVAMVDHEFGLVRTDYHIAPDGPPDPNIIYTAMRSVVRREDDKICHIVSNGKQTDTVARFLLAGKSLEAAMLTEEHENDRLKTSRILAMVVEDWRHPNAVLVKIVRDPLAGIEDDTPHSVHSFHPVYSFTRGTGLALITYEVWPNELAGTEPLNPPPYRGDPFPFTVADTLRANMQNWRALVKQGNEVVWGVKEIPKRGPIRVATANRLERGIKTFVIDNKAELYHT